MIRKLIGTAVFILLALTGAAAQNQTPAPAQTPVSLETILTQAEKQTRFYQETFKNLLADERKTFERFNKGGGVKQQAVVESTLLIYQSPKDQNASTELRNVLRVDGKEIPNTQQRAEAFFAELQRAVTLERELEKIQLEGSRYDKTLIINGLTVSEALVLSEELRPFFNFSLTGTETFQGNPVYVVSYQQIKKSPLISLNENSPQPRQVSFNFSGFAVPKPLRKNDAFLRGKLWIDARTFQLWREERELTIQTPAPVPLLATSLEYQPSEYGILVPKQISLVMNELRKNSKENKYNAVNNMRVIFDYSKFRKTEVDVRIIDEP